MARSSFSFAQGWTETGAWRSRTLCCVTLAVSALAIDATFLGYWRMEHGEHSHA
jgi:hypothetical protein